MALIALNTDMSQADGEVILKKTLDNAASINFIEVKVNRKLVNEVEPVFSNIVVENELHVGFGYDFDSTVFDELDKGSKEDFPALFVLFLVRNVLADKGSDQFFHCDLEQKMELLCFSQEFDRLDEVFEVLFIFEDSVQVELDLAFVLELGNGPVDELNCQVLDVLTQLLLTPFDPQVELVSFLVNGNQKQHALFILAIDSQQISDELPVTVHIHSKVFLLALHQIVYFSARVLVRKTVAKCNYLLELSLRLQLDKTLIVLSHRLLLRP